MRLKAAKWGLKMVITKSYEYILDIMNRTENFITEHATMVDPIKLGLDERVAPKLFVADGAIITSKSNDSRLQYYGDNILFSTTTYCMCTVLIGTVL